MATVNEALLEMYYLKPFTEAFEITYGSKVLNIFKPSQQQEAILGFDQAWVKTVLSEKDLYEHISIGGRNVGSQSKFYVGYFMQFKVVERLKVIKRTNPPNKVTVPNHFTTPYYRSELKIKPSSTQQISQHQMLYDLSSNVKNAMVYYICPMLFDAKEIYDEPNLEKLQIIDVKTAPDPSSWNKDERHFIMFQNERGEDMHWCSEPILGRTYSFFKWLESDLRPNKLTREQVVDLLKEYNNYKKVKNINDTDLGLTIFEFGESVQCTTPFIN